MNNSKINFTRSKRIILPGIKSRDIKPLASLLSPQNVVVPMTLLGIISQISANLKGSLPPKEIQQISSIKLYSKILTLGPNSLALSSIYSLSKTLGLELEILSLLNINERLKFLRELQKKLIQQKGPGTIFNNNERLSDPVMLLRHRKGLAMQCRSVLIGTSIFSPHEIAVGIPIENICLKDIIDSSRVFWLLLGLNEEEFDFLLRKESLNCLKKLSKDNLNFEVQSISDCLKVLVFYEIKTLLNFKNKLQFDYDQIILHGNANLTLLERELGFVDRSLVEFPGKISEIKHFNLEDNIIRAAIDQRKNEITKLENIYRKLGVEPIKTNSNIEYLNKIQLKKII